ncbi:MAG: 1-acyl-sn-glycerol-3-phosphate acyltransferase [Akkermansiaceae bacterium]|jgi:putative hemolysin
MSSDETAEEFADARKHLPFLARHETAARILEGILCYPFIRRCFAESASDENPFMGVVRLLGLEIRMEGLAQAVPSKGPVVVVANHSHGGADALALMAVMGDLRKDFLAMANREVTLLEGVLGRVIPVSLLESEKRGANPAGLRATIKHVRAGGALGIFPAGRVSFWQGDRMRDPEWNPHVVKLLERMDATVVPLWFFGRPPAAIGILSKLSAFVRTALIPTGLVKMRGGIIRARAGEPFSTKRLREQGDGSGAWLRRRIEMIAEDGN